MTDPLVSVCIGVHNGERYIAETLSSALAQTYGNLQIIVVDDASTDGTLDVVKSFDDPRIEIHTLDTNRHMCFAFNEALRHARGEYIAHLDADDVWYPQKTARQVAYLESHPDVGACFAWPHIIDDQGRNTTYEDAGRAGVTTFHVPNRSHARWVRELLDHGNRFCHPSAMVRANVQRDVGEYAYGILQLQDFDLWTRVLTRHPVHLIAEPLMAYRILGSGANASTLDGPARNRHDAELADIAYRFVNGLPADLFAEAFADRLRLTGEHTADEWECEKAFVLLRGLFTLQSNPVLGLRKLHELTRERRFVDLLERRFGFTLLDLYAVGRAPVLADSPESTHELHVEIRRLHNELTIRDQEISKLHADATAREERIAAVARRPRSGPARRCATCRNLPSGGSGVRSGG